MKVLQLSDRVRDFLSDDRGATAIEYALIAGGISIVIVTLAMETGESLQDRFQAVADGLNSLN